MIVTQPGKLATRRFLDCSRSKIKLSEGKEMEIDKGKNQKLKKEADFPLASRFYTSGQTRPNFEISQWHSSS